MASTVRLAEGPASDDGPDVAGHDEVVLDAMTRGERLLTVAVLVINLSLAAWLVQRADFSQVRPGQGSAVADRTTAPPASVAGTFERDVKLIPVDGIDR